MQNSICCTRRAGCNRLLPGLVFTTGALLSAAGCNLAAQGQNSEGVRLFQQAYYQGALERFQQAIQNDPNNADGYYNLAATHHRLGKLHQNKASSDQAENYYNQCLDRNPNHQDCYRGLGVLLVEQGRTAEAMRLLEGWAQRSPTLAGPKIELARLSEESGNREAAKQYLIEAVATEPSNARALAALGKLREQAGDSVQALADYQRSLAINRFQPEVAARAGLIQQAMSPAPIVTPPGSTRVVTSPMGPVR